MRKASIYDLPFLEGQRDCRSKSLSIQVASKRTAALGAPPPKYKLQPKPGRSTCRSIRDHPNKVP